MWIEATPPELVASRLDDGGSHDRAEDVGGAGDGEDEEGQGEAPGGEAEGGDREAPGADGEDDCPARVANPPDPAGQGGADEGARGRRRRQEPDAGRACPEDVEGRAGKSEVGIPKTIATRSITNVLRTIGRPRT